MRYIACHKNSFADAKDHGENVSETGNVIFHADNYITAVRHFAQLGPEYIQLREWNPDSDILCYRQPVVCNLDSQFMQGILKENQP